jgi:hypothetical protein
VLATTDPLFGGEKIFVPDLRLSNDELPDAEVQSPARDQ